MEAMNKKQYDVARLTLQTLINAYPDSEYVARAKLTVGESWYQDGTAAGMTQAETEFRDFITFFPNMPEAAEAQLKIAEIHYRQMGKPDRDYTHAAAPKKNTATADAVSGEQTRRHRAEASAGGAGGAGRAASSASSALLYARVAAGLDCARQDSYRYLSAVQQGR